MSEVTTYCALCAEDVDDDEAIMTDRGTCHARCLSVAQLIASEVLRDEEIEQASSALTWPEVAAFACVLTSLNAAFLLIVWLVK